MTWSQGVAVLLFVCPVLTSAFSFTQSSAVCQRRASSSCRSCGSSRMSMTTREGGNRRSFLSSSVLLPLLGGLSAIVGASAGTAGAALAETATGDDQLVDTYWGNGCFWHVQHEMIKAEKDLLGRTNDNLTSLTGYAGAKKGAVAPPTEPGAKLCYHNLRGMSDYGKAGAAEVVRVRIPAKEIPAFAQAYFDLFAKFEKRGGVVYDRRDPQDRGGEYRSLLGIPGGASSPYLASIKEAAAAKGISLFEGQGGDPDTLFKQKVFVHDTEKFPFYPGEVYHQFHNDMTEFYGREYNGLKDKYFEAGKISETGCPEGIL